MTYTNNQDKLDIDPVLLPLLGGSIQNQVESSQSNYRGLLQGLKRYCENHPEAKRARMLYQNKLDHYKQLYFRGV
jgi:hypothetical protein